MIILIKKGCEIPKQGHPGEDAAFDLTVASGPNIVGESIIYHEQEIWSRIDYIEYGTGLFVLPEDDKFYIEVVPRSSASKYDLLLKNSEATIDRYTGEIKLRYAYHSQPEDLVMIDGRFYTRINPLKIFKQGERFAQMKVREKYVVEFKEVEVLPETKRGAGAFGSTGTK